MRVIVGLAVLLVVLAATGMAALADVPPNKRTVLGKYLSAKDAHDVVTAERDKLLFVDVRTGAELILVGAAGEIDVQVPFSEFAEPRAWDAKANRMQMTPNPNFVADVEAALARKGLTKASKVVIMCRSGERSARAVDTLAKAGFTDVWSVYDGFEGDSAADGHRTVNGWKNARLPWSYKLDRAKLSPLSAPIR